MFNNFDLFSKITRCFLHRIITWRRITSLAVLVGLIITGVVLVIVLHNQKVSITDDQFVIEAPDPTYPLPPTPSILGEYSKAAVVSNGHPCAGFGK